MTDETDLKAGVSFKPISPPIGVDLCGHGYYRNRKARSVHRSLGTYALVLAQGDTRIALLQADLLAVSPEITARARAAIAAATDIPADHVLIACSHTHSGPATVFLRGCGEIDSAYVSLLPRTLAGAVIEAADQLEATEVYTGQSTLTGLAISRVEQDGMVDTAVQTLEFISQESDQGCVVFSFGCQPITLPVDDTRISPDFLGAARHLLERDYDHALFLQGSCGDSVPIRAHADEDRSAGQMLAGAALIAVGQATPVENTRPLRCVRRSIELPLNVPTCEALERRRDANRARLAACDPDSDAGREARFWVEATESLRMRLTGESDPWMEMLRDAQQRITARLQRDPRLNELAAEMDLPPDAVLQLLQTQQQQAASGYNAPQTLSCELQAIQIGDIAILAHPTALFSELGLEIRRRSPFAQTLVVGCANDYLGPLPTEAEYVRQGDGADAVPYRLDQFPFVPHVGRLFVEECVRLLTDLHGG